MSVRNRPTALLFAASLLVSVASYAAEYSLDFTGAKALDAEVPVLRRAEMAADVGTVPAVAVGDTLNLKLFGDVTLSAKVAYALPASFAGGRAFSLVLGDGVSSSTFVESPDGLLIELRDVDADRLYNVFVRGDKSCVEEIDLSLMRRGGCIEVDAPEPEDADEGSDASATTGRKLLSAVPGNPFDDNAVAPAPVTVDIMLIFDNGAQTWVENSAKYSSITNFAIVQVAKMNQVLHNTDLHTNFWYRLVDVATVNGRWTAVDNTVLPTMRTGIIESSGIWSEVATRREACGADVVSLIIDTGSAYGTTGIGYITHGNNYNTWVNTYRTWCYSCCAIRSVENDYTLSHEVGHNMGLTHSPTLPTWSKIGTFEYSNGYNITNANDGKHYSTIMAYNYDKYYSDYIEIPYFSSPNHTFKGVPLGTAISNDCTRALRQTCVGIADWHAKTIPLPSDIAFSPNASSAYRISLSTLGGYEIRYTTDGSEPTRESTLYSEPLTLMSGEMTVKAVAIVDSETLGSVATKTYSAALTLGEYVRLEDLSDGWKWGFWKDQDDKDVWPSFWSDCDDKTAILDAGGSITVDTDDNITLGTLISCGIKPLEVVTSSKTLSADKLDVFGETTLAGSGFSFANWRLHEDSTLVLSPGFGQTTTLGKYLDLGATGSTIAISNGTFKVTKGANYSDGISTLQKSSVRVDNGGTLLLEPGWVLGFSNTNPITVNKGGLMKMNGLESTSRPLILNGGNVMINLSGRAYELRSMSISVTDDSSIIDATSDGGAEIYLFGGNADINVLEGKTLTVDARITTGSDANTRGYGINKNGNGEIRLLREVSHTGTNAVNAGTFSVGYKSTVSSGLHWSVASGATLKIEDGCSLQVPSLALSHGSSLVFPGASSAPLVVSGALDLEHVSLSLSSAEDLEYDATYPLAYAAGGITGLARVNKSDFPVLSDGLDWKIYKKDNTLYAKVLTVAEAREPLVLVSNNAALVLDVPDEGVSKQDGGVMVETAPLAIDRLDAKAVAITLDVVIPEGDSDSQQTLCSWKLVGTDKEALVRCVRKPDGTVFCFYYDSSYSPNETNSVSLSAGRHVVKIAYRSDGDYSGTLVYVDDTPAYYSTALKWSTYNVSRITIGATASATPALPFAGLVVKGVAVVEPLSSLPIANMTVSGAEVSYNYLVPNNRKSIPFNNLPAVFGLTPAGGFTMDGSCLDASFSDTSDAVSVSVVASFPADSLGAIIGIWTKASSGTSAYTSQVDYNGDGTFATRYNGYVNQNKARLVNDPDSDVESPHLYTFTYTKNEGFRFYQDGVQILEATSGFQDKNYDFYYKVTFGCGPWNLWTTSYDDSANPMPRFKVYASHIAFGTDDILASADPVFESLNFDSAYDGMSIAKKLSYLPTCQTATGVAAPSDGPDEPDEPETPIEPESRLPVVDVLVAFDNGAQAYVAEKSMSLEAFAEAQIAKMNDALATNRLDTCYSYRLAGVCKVDATYKQINAISTDLAEGVGPLATLRAQRELYGADTVTLLIDNVNDATLGYGCPLSTTDVAGCHDDAFSVCSIKAVHTGKQHTMLHENAHNMGCGHADNVQACSPFAYGRGFYFEDPEDLGVSYHTIMAYGGNDDASWYFSTSDNEYPELYRQEYGYIELGDANHDNRRVLTETCGTVSQWRDCVKPFAEDVVAMDPAGEEIFSGRVFKESIQVVLSSPNDATIYYTTDGTAPTSASSVYSSPLCITEDATLMVASLNGTALSPVRTIKLFRMDAIPDEGVWRTSAKYPWSDAGQGELRSFNYTEYGHKCTTPLSVKVEGPKLLRFKHKSYFSTPEVDSNYSHIEVLLDDSAVLSTNYFDVAWSEDVEVVIPSGEHEVQFVYSQRDSLYAPFGNFIKDGNVPLYEEALWIKDIAFDEVPRVEFENNTSTSDDVAWELPYVYEAKELDGNLGGIEVGTKGIVETLGFGSTNAVVLSVLAELPEGKVGEIAGCKIYRSDDEIFHAFAYSNGDGTFSLGYADEEGKNTLNTATSKVLNNWKGLHIWTFAFGAQKGAKLYCDSELIAETTKIQWANTTIKDFVSFGDDPRGGMAIDGIKIYAVDSDFGVGESIFNQVDGSVNRALTESSLFSSVAEESLDNKLALLSLYNETGSIPDKSVTANNCVLRISEIMPKPTDDRTLNGHEGMDVNGLESGWVEVENTSDQWADLKDYRFIRVNRGKKTDPAGVGNFPSRLVPPRGRAIFYTSERYSNSKDKSVSAFAEGTFDGKPTYPQEYYLINNLIMVWGDKVNPKKSPYVRLYYAPGGDSDKGTVVDTVVVPSDLPEGWSIIVGEAAENEGTRRWMCPTPTRNAANTKTDGLTRIGPNVGPLYERPDQKKTDLASEFTVPTPPAVPGTDYTVTLPINGVMNPDGTFTPRTADQIQSIKFVYRKDLDDATLVTNDINMATKTTVENWGDQYTATIPSDYFPAAGHLMQWKVLITDGEGTEWTSPSFNNKDDGYEWYGTIVEPGALNSATLPTWHMFAEEPHLTQMDKDKDDQDLASVPNYARIAIYDSSTSNYYDYVRIDLRGHTSAKFTKKGHGLRFAKAHPLTMRDCVTGEDIEEIRKTSLISEFADPSFMRQMIAFWLWRKMGNLVPFDFPVRCNLNGEFYQLAFNSERFTDELIEDVYGLDKFGYSYKNVGTMNLATTTAGSIEKKTPDDEDESNISVLTNSLVKPLQLNGANVAHSTSESALLTKFVVKKFDLPAWINYLASARITQEMDDVWANVCAYYDNPDMLGGVRGKDTWMPLGYDFNLTFGQYYINDLDSNALAGLSATNDWYKSHPLYGGWTIRARKSPSGSSMNGNNGFEAIYQSAKFRRLYLRRLRTLMDQELKEPGTLEGDTPFMSKMREMADLMRADATLDLDKWKDDTTDNAIDVWKNTTRPADMDAGIDDIWHNYVVPRREHLYVTHSVTNTAKAIGYDSDLNAGIPEAQSPIATLAPNISIANLTALDSEQAEALGVTGQFYGTEVVVIRNYNDEVVDMSGWKLAFSVDFTFPAGTVCDANDSIYIVADRRTYIEAHDTELTDQVIVGNATFAGTGPIALYAADGTLVYSAIPQTNELKYLRLHSFYGNTLNGGDTGEWFTLTNISDSVTLDLADVTVCFLKQGDDHDTTGHCHVTLTNKKGKGDVKPLKSWTARQSDYADKGWTKIQNNKQQITIYDKYGSVCQSLKVEQKKFPLAYGNGGYLVCDSTDASVTKNSQWHAALYELANDGELSEPFSAEDQEVANELVATAKPVLSEEDIAAGLNEQFLQYLMIVAEPVEGSSGQYKAVVVVNPDTVEVPVVGVDEFASAEPVEIEDDEGGKTVSISITNAIIGLWYGYEVADELGDASSFENDVPSFKRATDASHTVTGSLRSQASGFFRVKVLPAKPVDP